MHEDLEIFENEFRQRIRKIKLFLEEENLGALLVFSGPACHMWHQTGHVSYLSNWYNFDRITDSMVMVMIWNGNWNLVY